LANLRVWPHEQTTHLWTGWGLMILNSDGAQISEWLTGCQHKYNSCGQCINMNAEFQIRYTANYACALCLSIERINRIEAD
jgi:hypothetical protein